MNRHNKHVHLGAPPFYLAYKLFLVKLQVTFTHALLSEKCVATTEPTDPDAVLVCPQELFAGNRVISCSKWHHARSADALQRCRQTWLAVLAHMVVRQMN